MNRNYSDISYAESPFGTLSEFMSKTFGWMFAGLLVTFLVGIGAVTTGLIYPLITSGLFILTSIAELVLVFVLSARVQTLQPSTATGIFFAYAVLNGLNLSSIFLVYDFGSLILAFLVGAVYFGVMAVYGNVTNRDLTGWGPKLMGGLVALIVCGLVGGLFSLFGFGFGIMDLVLCAVGLLISAGSTMLAGDDPEKLEIAALALVKDMRTLPGLRQPRIEGDLRRPEITIKPRFDLAAELGVTTAALPLVESAWRGEAEWRNSA